MVLRRVSFFSPLPLIAMTLVISVPRPALGTDGSQAQRLWSPYWTVEPGFTSTLEMKNNRAADALTVLVSLYFFSGEEHHLPPMQLAPRQSVQISINQVIESLPPATRARVGKEGAAVVSFESSNNAALMGAISVRKPEQGIAWNFRLYPVKPTLAVAPIQGLFWFHDESTDGFVALQNASEDFISVTPTLQLASGSYTLPTLRLAPSRGLRLRLREELQKLEVSSAAAGGIRFSYEGPADALKAHGVLFNDQGFPTELDFIRFPGGSTATYQAVIVSSQFQGISTSIVTGVSPELGVAVNLFNGTTGNIVGGSPCFFSPTASEWAAIQSALSSGTTTVPSMANDPQCYALSTPGRQIVIKSSVPNHADGRGAPAFVFERQKSSDSNPSVVQIP